MRWRVVVAAAVGSLLVAQGAAGGDAGTFRKPGPRDKCPVCGMFVAPYADFLAQVTYRDGSVAYFDGAKDLFRYLHDLARSAPGRRSSELVAILVTDYYELAPIDARRAYFALGGDVYGPMGKELIPFASEEDAREFMKDHRATGLLRFDEVTPRVLAGLD